jgi:hypothetical protein
VAAGATISIEGRAGRRFPLVVISLEYRVGFADNLKSRESAYRRPLVLRI